jgi:hypothetical protein
LICPSTFYGEDQINVGRSIKRQILFQRLEVNMSQGLDLLRGPVLGVIAMIMLLAGVILITAFAALIAQMSLLLRLKPWNTSEKRTESTGSESGKGGNPQEPNEQRGSQQASPADRQRSPSEHPRRGQVVVIEPNANEIVDAVWWEAVR